MTEQQSRPVEGRSGIPRPRPTDGAVATYFLAVGGTILALDLSGWGWTHLLLGVLVLATGVSLLGSSPPPWARGVGVFLVAVHAIVQLAFLPAYPIWSIIVIALDVVVLYALIVTPSEDARQA